MGKKTDGNLRAPAAAKKSASKAVVAKDNLVAKGAKKQAKALEPALKPSKKTGAFGRSIGTGVAVPRFASERTRTLKESKKLSAQTSKRMEQRRSILAAVMEARIGLIKRERKLASELPFKARVRKITPIVFTLEEVQAILRAKSEEVEKKEIEPLITLEPKAKKLEFVPAKPTERRVLGAASIQDILGFNPKVKKAAIDPEDELNRVPKKWLHYYKALIKLREHFRDELAIHAEDTLKKSVVEDLGDNQDLNDGSSESCNRDLVLSLLSSEQEALNEIDEAIKRILSNTYGLCEVTQKPISKERLAAVPFTRYSLEGQMDYERSRRRESLRSTMGNSVFLANTDEEAPDGISRDDIDDE